MGTFGFFLFLSVAAVAYNWRVARVAQLQRDMLKQLIDSGQQVDPDKLHLLQPKSRPIAFVRWKIAVLLVLGCGSLVMSYLYWEAGTLPLVVAAIFALGVAGAAWEHERKVAAAARTGDQ